MAKSHLDEIGKYEYLCPDGETVLELRAMSDRERKSFLSGRLMVLQKQEAQLKQYIFNLNNLDGDCSYEELCEKYRHFYEGVKPIVVQVALGNTLNVFNDWDDPAYFIDILGLIGRIMIAEQNLLTGQEVPAQVAWPTKEEVAAMTEPEAEALGEDSPPKASPMPTLPSELPAAKSSPGRKTTTGTRRKTSATSPGPQ